ncbi:MAG: VOC family protein [Acidobacteria bacterium]|nr:VOC family protein [Acidobacteriota bacterium]
MENTHGSTVIPGVRYRDCVAAIEWLCNALGFAKHAVYMGDDGTVMHAELTSGNGMIMLGSTQRDSPYKQYATTPEETGGRETHSVAIIVEDCDAVYAQAKAAGAQMVFDLEEKPYGGKVFTCRDPEGYLWHVGSYNPWEPK